MGRLLFKKPTFLIGFTFLFIMLVTSFLYEPLFAEHVKKVDFLTIDGELVGAPFSPVHLPPFGSDRLGTPLWAYIIQGAKYTILVSLCISLLQVFVALVLSVLFLNFFKKIQQFFEGLVESMIYIPGAVLAYWLLFPLGIVIAEPREHFVQIILIQTMLISLIGIPPVIVVLLKEIQKALQEEYVLSSKTLGGRGWFLYRKHVLTSLAPRLVQLFFQRNVQVLVLLAHLGFLTIFLGGSFVEEITMDEPRLFSLSNEWAGNIGKAYFELLTAPWIIFAPLIALSLAVLSFNFMASSIQDIILKDSGRITKWQKGMNKVTKTEVEEPFSTKEPFTHVHEQSISENR